MICVSIFYVTEINGQCKFKNFTKEGGKLGKSSGFYIITPEIIGKFENFSFCCKIIITKHCIVLSLKLNKLLLIEIWQGWGTNYQIGNMNLWDIEE